MVMPDDSYGCALCAAGKGVITGRKWPEHLLRFRFRGAMFECHVRCTPMTGSKASLIAEIKANLEGVAPRKRLRRVVETRND